MTFSFFFCFFWGLHQWHMEVPRLGVESELQLLAYTTATAAQDLSCICDLHHSSQQCRIPLSEARGRTRILMDTSQNCFHCATVGTPIIVRFLMFYFIFLFFCLFLLFLWAAPAAYGGSQARGPIRAVATGLRQSHSNAGSEPRLQPTPQLTATPDR